MAIIAPREHFEWWSWFFYEVPDHFKSLFHRTIKYNMTSYYALVLYATILSIIKKQKRGGGGGEGGDNFILEHIN